MTSLAVAKSFAVQKWGEYAYSYDALLSLAPYRRMMWEVIQEVTAGDQEIILDASCGTGNFEHILCSVVGKQIKQIVGVDSSHEMLDAARDKNADINHVTFLSTDLNKKLLFKDNAFTQVVSINTLYAVESPEFTLSEFHRVLTPGGKLHLVTPKHGYENGLIMKEHCKSSHSDEYWLDAHASAEREELLIREAIKDESLVQRMLSVAKYNREIAHNAHFHFYKMNELHSLLLSSGFVINHTSLTYAKQDFFITATKGV